MYRSLLDDLVGLVGRAGLVAADEIDNYTTDWSGRYRSDALAVVRPANTEQVSAVVARCREAGVSKATPARLQAREILPALKKCQHKARA